MLGSRYQKQFVYGDVNGARCALLGTSGFMNFHQVFLGLSPDFRYEEGSTRLVLPLR